MFSTYINFQSVFTKFDNDPGFAGGLVTVAFDPGYASNGVFYTVHTEDAAISGSALPSRANLPGLATNGYTLTGVINPPVGNVSRQAVLIEWTDTNIANGTFEGTARELLRLGFNGTSHPMGDLAFNPLAGPDHPDFRNLYVAVGDGASGESTLNEDGVSGVTAGDRHYFPQRLDTLIGKILRLTPDRGLRPGDPLSTNGAYRIPTIGPDPNPFSATNGARGEVFALGFRNPHRLSWDAETGQLVVTDIGRYTFEEVNLVVKGGNYGWGEREGTRGFFPTTSGDQPPGTSTFAIPASDFLPLRLNATTTNLALVAPLYPVAEFYQDQGDAISSGLVYRGTRQPRLRGKYIFGDITTGRLLYADLAEMIAAFDTDPGTLATVHELQVVFDNPTDSPDLGAVRRRLFDIVADEYTRRGGNAPGSQVLPGTATGLVTFGNDPDGVAYGGGRADIRLAPGGDGEIYVLSKSDGMIRQMTAVVAPPVIQSITLTNGVVTLTWQSIAGASYRVQSKPVLEAPAWNNLPGDVTATGPTASKTNTPASGAGFYRVQALP